MQLPQNIWKYIPVLFSMGAVVGCIDSYLTKPLPCVDCTAVGSTSKPEFWIE